MPSGTVDGRAPWEDRDEGRAELQRRLLTFVAASGSVLGSPDPVRVSEASLALARDLFDADGFALWRLEPDGTAWLPALTTGVSAEYTEAVAPRAESGNPLPFTDLLVVEDVANTPLLQPRRSAYLREGIVSMLVIPLVVRERMSGTLAVYYRTPHAFSEVERHIARALGHLASAAITTAELYEEQRRRREEADFISAASALLGSSLDYQETLTRVAGLAVPNIADWCTVDLLDRDGRLQRLAVAHVDPARVDLARRVQERRAGPSAQGAPAVIRSGQPQLVPVVTDEMLSASAGDDAEYLAMLRALGIGSFMCVPMNAQGRTVGAITFVAAESRRRFTPADLQFAQHVADRAGSAIENARAFEDARQANRVKDAFLAMLSHELRTPLNAIVGYLRMLRLGVVEDARRDRALDIVERNARTLTQMVNDVLDVSRIESGKLRLDRQPVNLTALVRGAVDTVQPTAGAKSIAITPDLPDDDLMVRGDASRLQQVVWNLLTNAVKFTPPGGHVRAGLERQGRHAVLSVADSGVGIAPEFLPHLFEPFRQAEGAVHRDLGGLGLGLAISRRIIEMHEGSIAAESPGPGQGTTMRFSLPLDTE